MLSEIYNQDQIRKALQQSPAEFFLLKQFPLHLSLVGNIDQRALVAIMLPEASHTAREESRKSAGVPSLRLSLISRVRTAPRSPEARPRTG